MDILPRWIRSKYQLKKEIRKRFIKAMNSELYRIDEEYYNKFLYGDPNGNKPVGTIKPTFKN